MDNYQIQNLAQVYNQFGEILAAKITAMGMEAENQYRVDCGNSIAYGDEAFFELVKKIEAAQTVLQSIAHNY